MIKENNAFNWSTKLEDIFPPLWPNQKEAVMKWNNNGGKGILAMATGTGKTRVAIEIIHDHLNKGYRILIAVPALIIKNHWRDKYIRKLCKLNDCIFTEFYQKNKYVFSTDKVVIGTMQSLYKMNTEWYNEHFSKGLIVVDECHRIGAEEFSKILERSNFQKTLGLSATPERYEKEGNRRIYEGLGNIVYRYELKDAIQDGILQPYNYYPIIVNLTIDEFERYVNYQKRINDIIKIIRYTYLDLKDSPLSYIYSCRGMKKYRKSEIFKEFRKIDEGRKSIIFNATEKDIELKKLLMTLRDRKTILFHQRISKVDEIFSLAKSQGLNSFMYHSELLRSVNEEELEGFENSQYGILVCAKALDEGADIPTIDTVVLVATGRGHRQIIQRIGRSLRRKNGQEPVQIYDFIVVPHENIQSTLATLDGVKSIVESEYSRLNDISQCSYDNKNLKKVKLHLENVLDTHKFSEEIISRHHNVHKFSNNYMCKICDKKFGTKSFLSRHQKNKHGL